MKHQNRLNELLIEFTVMSQNKSVPNLEKTDYEDLIDFCIFEKKYDSGLEITEAAMTIFPYSPEFVVKKIELLLAVNQPKQALSILEHIDHLTKLSHKAQILKAEALNASGNQKEALDLLNELEKELDGDFSIFQLQAEILEGLQQFDRLYHVIKNQILAAPKEKLDNLLAKHFLFTEITENHLDAISFYVRVTDEHPFSHTAWLNLGLTHKALGNLYEAVDAFEFSIAIHPSKTAYFECAACFEEDDKYDRAINYYNEYLTLFQHKDPDCLVRLGNSFLHLGQINIAQKSIKQALKIDSQLPEGHFLLGKSFLDKNEPQKAIKALESAIDIDPFNEDYPILLAEAHQLLGQLDEAEQYFQLAVDVAPDLFQTWIPYIGFLIETERTESLENALEEVATFFNEEQVLYLKVASLFAADKRKEAIYWLAEALSLNFEEHTVLFSLLPELLNDADIADVIQQYQS